MTNENTWRSHYYLHDDPLERDGGWPEWVTSPRPPVDLGPCPICGRPTKRCSTSQSPFETMTTYACSWCRAGRDVFHTGPPGHSPIPRRPFYAPPDMRWDMCKDPDGNGRTPRYHALGHWGLTLCGLAGDDLTDLDPQWRPDHPEACPACRTAAAEIDTRWPLDRRSGGDFLVRCPCPACRSTDPGSTR